MSATTEPTTTETFQRILAQLKGLKGRDGQYSARCPAHDDDRQSFSLTLTTDGVILMLCHAGCDKGAILKALGLDWPDLFPPNGKREKRPKQRGQIVKVYDYHDLQGNLAHQTVRYDPKDFSQRRPDGQGGWIWDLECTRFLYHEREARDAKLADIDWAGIAAKSQKRQPRTPKKREPWYAPSDDMMRGSD